MSANPLTAGEGAPPNEAEEDLPLPEPQLICGGLWYANSAHEHALLVSEFSRCELQITWLLFVSAVFVIVRYVTGTSWLAQLFPPAIGLFVFTFLGELFCVIAMRHLQDLHREANRTASKKRLDEKTRLDCTIVTLARVHEGIVVVGVATTIAVVAVVHAEAQDSCDIIYSFDDRPDDHQCGNRMWPYAMWSGMLPIYLGQPRLAPSLACYALLLAIQLGLSSYHDTNHAGHVLIAVFHATFIIFCVFLKRLDEARQRKRYEGACLLEHQTRCMERHDAMLKSFVEQHIPLHLRARLNSPTALSQVDESDAAVCIVMNIANIAEVMTSNIPSTIANKIGQFNAFVVQSCNEFHLHHIREVGDSNTIVGNLIFTETTFEQDASFRALLCAASCINMAQTSQAFPLCLGVAEGKLFGTMIGTTCITYDVFGPALSNAQNLAQTCPSTGCIRVCRAIYERNSSFVVLDRKNDELSASQLRAAPDDDSVLVSGLDPSAITIASTSSGTTTNELGDSTETVRTLVSTQESDSLTLKAMEEMAMDLTQRKLCLVAYRYDSDETEAAADRSRRVHNRSTFIFCSAFFSIMSLLTLVIGVVDRHDNLDAPFIVFVVGTVLFVVGFATIAIKCYVLNSSSEGVDQRSIAALYTLCVGSLIITTFARPSIVGDSTGYLVVIYTYATVSTGGGLVSTSALQLVCMVAYGVTMVAFRPIISNATVMVFIVLFIALHSNFLFHAAERTVFEGRLQAEKNYLRLQHNRHVREAIYDAHLPKPIQHRVTLDSIKKESIDCWPQDQCVILHLITTTLPGSDASDAPSSRCSSGTIKEQVTATFAFIHEALDSCEHGALSIFKIFGGTIILGGPTTSDSAAAAAAVGGGEDPVLLALEDAMHFIRTLRTAAAGRDLPFNFTCGVALEQVVNVLRLNELPSYAVFGSAIQLARALAIAAPTFGIVVATEKLLALYERECNRGDEGTVRSEAPFGAVESWRIRGLGIVRARSLRISTSVSE